MKPENYKELKRNYLILFAVIFFAGILIILRSDSINMSVLSNTLDGFDQNTVLFGGISWIVVGSIFSLLSGFAIVQLLLKDIERQSLEDEVGVSSHE
jgi:hypothetical protein